VKMMRMEIVGSAQDVKVIVGAIDPDKYDVFKIETFEKETPLSQVEFAGKKFPGKKKAVANFTLTCRSAQAVLMTGPRDKAFTSKDVEVNMKKVGLSPYTASPTIRDFVIHEWAQIVDRNGLANTYKLLGEAARESDRLFGAT